MIKCLKNNKFSASHKKCDINKQNNKGETIIMISIINNNLDLFKHYLTKSCYIELSLQTKYKKNIFSLIEEKQNINIKDQYQKEFSKYLKKHKNYYLLAMFTTNKIDYKKYKLYLKKNKLSSINF